MNRYALVTQLVFTNLEQKCFGIKKTQGYLHLIGVSTLMIVLAKKRNLDSEIAGCIGILHDYATYYHNTSFNHASHSSVLAASLLKDTSLFTDKEIDIIVQAVSNHSNKDTIEDNYSELIKDVDAYQHYLLDPKQLFSTTLQQRIDTVKQEIE